MKKLFNSRPLLFFALFFAAGIYFAFRRIRYPVTIPLIIAATLVLCSAAGFFAPRLCFKNNIIKGFFTFLNKHKFLILSFIPAFAAGFCAFYIAFDGFSDKTSLDGVYGDARGNVIQSYKTENGGYFLLEKVFFTTGGNTEKIAGKVFVYVRDSDNLPQTGDTVFFKGKITPSCILEAGEINSYAYRNSVYYIFYINKEDYTFGPGSPSVFVFVRKYIKDTLYKYLREDNAGISYALVTGDSLLMDKELKQNFFEGGIAHVFSVSGLHISVLVFALNYLFGKLRLKNIYRLIITFIALLFYSGVCNFSPAVLRAFLMAVIYLAAKTSGRKYDPLTSVSAAVLLILLITPLMLFDTGFLLSVSSVYGILLLGRKLNVWLKFIPRVIRLPLVISSAAQIGLLPVLAASFGQLPLFSLILNLLLIPVINVIYITLLILISVSAVLPFLSFLFFLPQGLTEAVKFCIRLAVSLGVSSTEINPFGIGAVFFYTVFAALSGFVFLNFRRKAAVSVISAVIFVLFTALSYMPFHYGGESISFFDAGGGDFSLVTSKGKAYFINYGGNNANYDEIKRFLMLNGIIKIEAAVFFTDIDISMQAKLLGQYGVNKVIMPYSAWEQNNLSENSDIKYLYSGEEYIYENIAFSAYYYNGGGNTRYCGGYVDSGGINALYINDSSQGSMDYIKSKTKCDIKIACAGNNYAYAQENFGPFYLITQKYCYGKEFSHIYSTDVYGHLIFKNINDRIVKDYRY